MKNFLTVMVLLVLIASCSTPQKKLEKQAEPTLKDQVMDVHDEVMPRMGELRKTQKELLALMDSSVADSAGAARLGELAKNIELANESMMAWMRNFDPELEGTPEEVEQYLQSQLKSIEQVKKEMLTSLEEGKKALSKD